MAAAGGSNEPKTIREMLLWLYGLGVQSYYGNKVKNYISSTLKSCLIRNHPTAMTGIEKATTEAKELIQTVCNDAGKIIVTIQKGEAYKDTQHKSELDGLQQESQNFDYPEEEKDIFERFVYYFSCCFWQLEFFYKVCGAKSAVGCWGQCMYGKEAQDTQCSQHTQRCSHCSSTYKGCLQAFITATEGSTGTGSNTYTGATYSGTCNGSSGTSSQCPIPPMGFPKDKLPPGNSKSGYHSLHTHLRSYFNGRDMNFPKLMGYLKLLQLLEGLPRQGRGSTSPLSVPTSWIAGDLWAFFCKLKENTSLREKLKGAIGKEYGNGFQKKNTNPTQADYTDIDKVFKDLLFAGHNNNDHNSLLSLSDCEQTNTNNHCGKYMFSLFYDPFHWVLHWFNDQGDTNIKLLSFSVLQAFAGKLCEKLKEFKGELEKKDCVKNYSSCQCIVFCDETHSCMYQHGFTFQSPMSLAVKTESKGNVVDDNGRKGKGAKERKCSDLKDQLQEVTGNGSALEVFSKLEKFTPQPKGRSDDTGDTLSSVSTQTDKGSRAQKELQQQLCSLENTSVQTDVLSAPVGSLFNSCAATGTQPTPQPASQKADATQSTSSAAPTAGGQDASQTPPGAKAAPRAPNTIYEMLLWLYGLGQQEKKSEKGQLEDYIKQELCTQLTQKFSTASTALQKITNDAKGLIETVCKEAGKILVTIKQGEGYKDKHKGELDKLNDEIQKFEYKSGGQQLYNQFLYYLTCCYWQLEFLYKVCGVKSAVGGWGQCRYDKDGADSSDACMDNKGQKPNHQQRCDKCSKDYKGCLKAFLTAQPSGDKKNINNGAQYNGNCDGNLSGPCTIPPMGFHKDKLPTGNKNGSGLNGNLRSYFSGHNNNLPKMLGHLKLLDLLSTPSQGSSSPTVKVPTSWIAGDFWAFWYQLNKNGALRSKLNDKIKKTYDKGFRKNGSNTPNADYADLNDALSKLLFATHGSDNNHNSLLSLSDCDGSRNNSTNKCGKYLYGLFSDPFHWVLDWFKENIELLTFDALQNLASGLKDKLDKFKQGLEKKDCLKPVNASQCQCIVFCDDTHAELYKSGFTFMSPTSLAVKRNKGAEEVEDDDKRTGAQKRKCSDLSDQLEKVIGTNGALDVFRKLVKYVRPRKPLTIYEMLLWLYGLGQSDKTSEKQKLEGYIEKELTKNFKSPSNVSTHITNLTSQAKGLVDKVCTDAGRIILCIQKGQNYDAWKGSEDVEKNKLNQELQQQPFTYEKESKDLYNQFLYYLTCCFWQLRFLHVICGAKSAVGGWGQCTYGQSGPESSDACKDSSQQKNHEQRCQTCSSNEKYSGCLMTFLTETNGGQGTAPEKNIYKEAKYSGQCPQVTQGSGTPSCPVPPMGFDKEKLPNGTKEGSALKNTLNGFFSNTKNLPQLLGQLLILQLLESSSQSTTLQVPSSWSLPHLFAFWAAFKSKWKGQKTQWQQKFNEELKGQGGGTEQFKWKDNPGSPESLLEKLFKTYNNSNASEHSNTSSHNGITTLTNCEVNNGASSNTSHCGKYFHGLLELPFQHVLEEFKQDGLFGSFMTHETIKHFAKKFHTKLQEFQTKLKDMTCVQRNQCTCIAFCDATHSCMYQHGLTFMSPASLAVKKGTGQDDTTRKSQGAKKRKCSDLNTQLGHVLNDGAPLHKLTQLSKEVKPAPKPQGRSDDTQNNVQTSSPAAAKPVAAKPEAPKPQGGTGPGGPPPAGPPPPSSSSGTGTSTSSSTDPSGGQQQAPGPGSPNPGSKGDASPSAPGPGPGPPPPPPPGGADKVATPTTSNGQGQGRSDNTATLTVSSGGNDKVVAVVSGTTGPSSQARADPSPPPSSPASAASTPTTPTSTGNNGGSTPSPKAQLSSGTVHKRDNNKDGVALLSTFKNSFDGVLKQLTSTFNKVSKSAIDAIGTTSQYILKEINAHHSSLLEPPCNVKECLEWLDRVCTNGNKDCQCQSLYNRNSSKTQQCKDCMALDLSEAVNAILPGLNNSTPRVNNNTVQSVVTSASALFHHLKGPNYQPAYKLSAKWPTCGPATGGTNSGVQCSCCKKTDCQCSTASSPCDGTCCHRCDIRICAGIFIAMVPALDRALRELRDKLQKGNNGTKNINQSPVVEFLKHLGYEEKDLNTTTKGSSLPARLITPIAKLGQLSRYIKNLFEGKNLKGKNNSTHPCYFQAAKNSYTATTTDVSPAVTPSTDPSTACSTPGTVREMLLWLMGLPYCEGYKQFVEKLKEKSQQEPFKSLLGQNSSRPSTAVNTADHYLHRQYSVVIFQLPVLFFAVEGTVSYLRDTFCQFAPEHNRERLKKILNDDKKDCNNHVKSFQYPCDGDKLCAMFYDYTFKVHLQLRFLLTMCDTEQKDGGWKHCKYAAPAATSSAATQEESDCCLNHNLLCSCPDKKSKLPTTVSNSCRQLLREFLRDCETKDPIKGVNQDPKKGANKDPKKCRTDSSNAADHSSNDPVTRNIFQAPCSQLHVSMGFRVPECDHDNKKDCCIIICHYTGDEIRRVLYGLVDPAQGPSLQVRDGSLHRPLSVVTQWMIALQGQEPRSLGDILDLFRELCGTSRGTRNASTSALGIRVRNGQERKKMSDVLLEQLGAMLKDKYADYHSRNRSVTGAEAAKEEVAKIQVALHSLLDVFHHREQRKTPSATTSDFNAYSLVAIMLGCNTGRNNTCTAYVKSLSYGLYKYYAPEFNTQKIGVKKNSSDHIIDWLFKWCTQLYKKLKELKKRIGERCDCCLEGGKKKDPECTSIVACCQCPPELYRCGLVLGDPKTLNESGRKHPAKKCSDFIDSVSIVLATSAPLFKACEAIMTVVYAVLLMASKNKVYEYFKQGMDKDGLSAAQLELIVAFHRYVDRAMQCSKKKLMETFLRPLSERYNYEECDDQCHKRDVEVSVSASSVTSITAVIPQYTAPPIDPYHYRVMTKIECCEDCKGKKCQEKQALPTTQGNVLPACYSFQSALDFHVRGANCILPVPSDLRSAVDWLLRVTVGVTDKKNDDNDNISKLSDAIKSVFKECGVPVTDDAEAVQKNVTALVDGLRKFVGYQERSKDVISKVKEEKDSVQEQLKKNIEALNRFIGTTNRSQFGTELGIALQKAVFTVAQNGAEGDKKSLKCVIEELQGKLTEKHTDCNELKCNGIAFKYGSPKHMDSTSMPLGLSQLHEFLWELKCFAGHWNDIGKKGSAATPSSDVVFQQRQKAERLPWTFNGSTGSSSSNNTDYFNKLHQALEKLGQCAQKVQELNGNGHSNSVSYRKKITALIEGLKDEVLSKLADSKDTGNNNGSDPQYAVNGAQRLIEETKKGVECFITNRFRDGTEAVYGIYSESGVMLISKLIEHLEKSIQNKLEAYKSHLDDLKRLCQWLYRMGLLYASGLRGFVESLVSHLEHIIQVIDWIEKLKLYMTIVMNSNNAQSNEVKESITAGASTIAKLLSSYVLSTPSDVSISDDNASTYRTFLLDLRLLALDRYTLQVWQDECNDSNCRIKDWITFENGIIRHSDLNAIKQQLSVLTGIAYSSNTASSSASPSASRSRIHDFHAICVIQKFSYEAPITRLERSLKELKKIQGQLSGVKEKCNGGTELHTDPTVQPFCTAVTEFLADRYGIYSFAKFVHTIMGPNIFSAVIGALEELKESNKYEANGGNGNLDRIKGILGVLVDGLKGKDSARDYKLAEICKKLKGFITTLRKEYIFCYPVVRGTQTDKDCNTVCPGEPKGECRKDSDRECSLVCCVRSKDTSLACSSQSSVTSSLASATCTVSLTYPMPLLCAHCHLNASICPQCIPLLARIFITLVPVLYPQLCYLAYQCRLYWQQDHMNGYKDSALRSLMRTFGWPTECLSDYYIGYDVRIHGRFVCWLLNKERNSLRLLCQHFTEALSCSPFNEDSPLYRLYTLCVSYYRQKKNERLTQSKSTTPVIPTTLRQILRFFVYLPFSSQFDALQCTMQRYCSQSCVVYFSDLFTTMMMSSAMSAVLLQLIECPQGAFLRFFDEIYTNKDGLYFGTNTETLFYQLCDLSVTLYRGLKFLSLQCGTERSFTGWKDCRLRGVKGNNDGKDTELLDTQQLQLCAPHLCECQRIQAKDSSTTCSVLTSAARMCLTSGPSATAPSSKCLFPLLRYMTDDSFFDSTLTVPSALRKVCLNDSCQEMVYRHMAPRGWQKEAVQCEHRDEQQGDSQLRDCDQKACSSVCHLKDSDPLDSNCGVSCCHPCCRAQCSTLYGHDLFHLLRNFVGHEHDADPLLQFTRYMVSIAAWPPDSLSGYMTFMLRFSDWLRKERNVSKGDVSVSSVAHGNTSQENSVNSPVLSSLRSEISLFPGEFKPECLIGAFLRVTHCEHNNGAAHTPVASSSAAASLSSQCPTSSGSTISILRDCKDCQRLLHPLDYEIYDLYLPMYARRYLTWMLHFGPRLHRGMRELEKEFKRHIGESSVSQSGVCSTDPGATQSVVSSQGCSHSSIVHCPFALPELHSSGLHFWAPNRMCNVSCECLVERLQCSIQDSSLLSDFIRQCDSFLWSVRKPFYWLTMALWIVATVYLLFVHFWRLDSWRLLSHVIRSRASHLVYPKVLLAAEHSYERYYAQR